MNKGKVKEVLDFIVAICSIVSCIVAVYGVFKVVNFVVNVEPIVVLLTKEVQEGNLDAKNILNGSKTTVKYDTVRDRDTVNLSQNEIQQPKREDSLQWLKGRRPTAKDKQHLDNSADHISEGKKRDIDNQEDRFRQQMGNKMK